MFQDARVHIVVGHAIFLPSQVDEQSQLMHSLWMMPQYPSMTRLAPLVDHRRYRCEFVDVLSIPEEMRPEIDERVFVVVLLGFAPNLTADEHESAG